MASLLRESEKCEAAMAEGESWERTPEGRTEYLRWEIARLTEQLAELEGDHPELRFSVVDEPEEAPEALGFPF